MVHVQSLMFKKQFWTSSEARQWMKRNEYYPIKKVHKTTNNLRYRIRPPNQKRYYYRTKMIFPGVKAVIGRPR